MFFVIISNECKASVFVMVICIDIAVVVNCIVY